jgi:wyosine [tRNA(Phe)-imidazoG37] synthetase (radical SAM superfamily)
MKLVFGPMPSRRLGRSLGIDPVPFKTCNWNCVYCQLGSTTLLTSERKEFFPVEEVTDEVVIGFREPVISMRDMERQGNVRGYFFR